MTHRVKKPAKKKRVRKHARRKRTVQRVRIVPLQVYFSRDEHEALMMLSQRQRRSAAEVIRRLIVRSAAGVRSSEHAGKPLPADPRQLLIEAAERQLG